MRESGGKPVYFSLDDIYFEANRLVNLIDTLYEEGCRVFFLDEVHRYEYCRYFQGLEHAFIVSDDMEIGFKNRILLWLFGFLD